MQAIPTIPNSYASTQSSQPPPYTAPVPATQPRRHRLLVRIKLNDYQVHINDSDTGVIGLHSINSYASVKTQIEQLYRKMDAVEGVSRLGVGGIAKVYVLWNEDDSTRTKLDAENCRDVLKMVKLRGGVDVLNVE